MFSNSFLTIIYLLRYFISCSDITGLVVTCLNVPPQRPLQRGTGFDGDVGRQLAADYNSSCSLRQLEGTSCGKHLEMCTQS